MASSEFCPACGSLDNQVTDTRPSAIGRRRRRKCKLCSTRWTTFEVPVELARDVAKARIALTLAIETMQKLRELLPDLGADLEDEA